MEIVTISGTVKENTVVKVDKGGVNYICFYVIADSTPNVKKSKNIPYRCYSYQPEAQTIEGGDRVFLSGDFKLKITQENGEKVFVNFDVWVKQLQIEKR